MTWSFAVSYHCSATMAFTKSRVHNPELFEIKDAINNTCRENWGPYANYSCKSVSWDDYCRGYENGSLSSVGNNITDTFLCAKDSRVLYTIRSDNWNETLDLVSVDDIAMVARQSNSDRLSNVSLSQFLEKFDEYVIQDVALIIRKRITGYTVLDQIPNDILAGFRRWRVWVHPCLI